MPLIRGIIGLLPFVTEFLREFLFSAPVQSYNIVGKHSRISASSGVPALRTDGSTLMRLFFCRSNKQQTGRTLPTSHRL